MQEHPDWFARDERRRVRPPFESWHDVAQLDYNVPELRQYMTEMMLYWIREVGVDGFRCDVAAMVASGFWDAAREVLDTVKPVLMLAEDDQPHQHRRSFDLTYDWRLYQALGRLRAGRLRPATIEALLMDEQLDFPAGSTRLRFSSNHDLCAWHQPGMERYGSEAAKTAAVLTFTLPGVPLIYNGQEIGNRTPLPLFDRVPIDWEQGYTHDLRATYACLGRLRRQYGSLRGGDAHLLMQLADRNILGIVRTGEEETTYVLVNCSLEPQSLDMTDLLSTRPATLLGATLPGDDASARKIELPSLGYWIAVA
jgi:glycosidase